MGYQKIIVLAGLVCVTACAPVQQSVQQAVWNVQKRLRKPGEKVLALPDTVWKDYNCANRQLPFINVETNKLLPPRLRPGAEFNHRLVYAMCSNERADEILGILSTRIYFRSERIVNDVVENYSIKPGRWRVDTFITLPPDAKAGVYSIEIQFQSTMLTFQEHHSFVVEPS